MDEEVCIESQIGHIRLADLETSRGYGHPQVNMAFLNMLVRPVSSVMHMSGLQRGSSAVPGMSV